MSEKNSSNVVKGISSGFLRVALVVGAAILLVGGWIAIDQRPSFDVSYRFKELESIPSKVPECNELDATFKDSYAARTPKGASVHINYCFQKIIVISSEGVTYHGVAYKKTGANQYLVEESPNKYGSREGDRYVSRLMSQFKPSKADLDQLDQKYWGAKLSEVGSGLLVTIGFLLGWAVFCLVIRFIWRGFTNRD